MIDDELAKRAARREDTQLAEEGVLAQAVLADAAPVRRRGILRLFALGVFAWLLFLWLHQTLDGPGAPIEVGAIAAPGQSTTPSTSRSELRGRVRTTDGSSAADVLVTLVCGEELYWTRTDALGTFALDNLPRGRAYMTIVPLAAPGLDFDIDLPPAGPVEFELPPPHPPTPTLPEVRGQTLEGSVELPFERSPIAYEILAVPYEVTASGGGAVAAPGLDGRVDRRVRVDRNGWFRFEELALGDYELRIVPPWAGSAGRPSIGALIFHHDGRGGVPIVSASCGAIDGTVLGADGKAVVGAIVQIAAAGDDTVRLPTRVTDAAGRFVVDDAPEGPLRVTVRAGTRWSERTVRIGTRQREKIEMRLLLGS